jgi:hydroxymethylpyrimidine/phosphomethylpyrimidine kinase
MIRRKPRILSIAGSDSGGGAGIQADIKTITALGGYASCAITAITAQNSLGVHRVKSLKAKWVRAQIQAVLDDIGADVIKIGMLGSEPVIRGVAKELNGRKLPIVLDPVLVAKGGAKLLKDDAVSALRAHLFRLAHILTPNIPEAEVFTGLEIADLEGQREAAEILLAQGPKAVLVKGGHLLGDMVQDLLLWDHGEAVFSSPRLGTPHTHGTGCTLSSAIATYLGLGLQLEEAVRMARKYVWGAIENAPGFGKGHGPLDHGWQQLETNK